MSDAQGEALDAESMTGHLVPAGSVYAFLAGHRQVSFSPEMFTDLFLSGKGWPSVPPEVVASERPSNQTHGELTTSNG